MNVRADDCVSAVASVVETDASLAATVSENGEAPPSENGASPEASSANGGSA
jgi:hypothetical protein